MPIEPPRPRTVMVVHPSAELYGADRMALETTMALKGAGFRVVAVLPVAGPLADRLNSFGVQVQVIPFTVIRKSLLSPLKLGAGVLKVPGDLIRICKVIQRWHPHAIWVNTITIPEWSLLASLLRVPTVCHVHEAETDIPLLIRKTLLLPLLPVGMVVANSFATAAFLEEGYTGLGTRARVIHNGIRSAPLSGPSNENTSHRRRVAVVGRLSPRKGQDIAVRAIHLLVDRGLDVELELAGDVYPGYEWFRGQLSDQIETLGLRDRVTLSGFVDPVDPVYERASVVCVPSRVEPFGNTAVEAMLRAKPLVVARTGGLIEIVEHGVTGMTFTPGDARALAGAIEALLLDRRLARGMAEAARREAETRFACDRYASEIVATVAKVVVPGN